LGTTDAQPLAATATATSTAAIGATRRPAAQAFAAVGAVDVATVDILVRLDLLALKKTALAVPDVLWIVAR
jgi:hypothetical protein